MVCWLVRKWKCDRLPLINYVLTNNLQFSIYDVTWVFKFTTLLTLTSHFEIFLCVYDMLLTYFILLKAFTILFQLTFYPLISLYCFTSLLGLMKLELRGASFHIFYSHCNQSGEWLFAIGRLLLCGRTGYWMLQCVSQDGKLWFYFMDRVVCFYFLMWYRSVCLLQRL